MIAAAHFIVDIIFLRWTGGGGGKRGEGSRTQIAEARGSRRKSARCVIADRAQCTSTGQGERTDFNHCGRGKPESSADADRQRNET